MKELRTGYTTGTCAAAAAKAAAKVLCAGSVESSVDVGLPEGGVAEIEVISFEADNGTAKATVRKDAGDDPDVTDQATIEVSVSFNETGQIKFYAGAGVGTVTKAGLQVAIGEPAINPVPREMIANAVRQVTDKGLDMTVSVISGEELAKKTFNPRLGIVGGISIIGTSGIVRPFSADALKDALRCSLDVAAASGVTEPVYVPGRIGERAGRKNFELTNEQVIEVSNEWGYMLDRLAERDFAKLLAMGHPGKLAKLAAGSWNTHSSRSENALPFIREVAESLFDEDLPDAVTAEGFFKELGEERSTTLAKTVAELVRIAIAERVSWPIEDVAVVIVDMKGAILGQAGDTKVWKRK